MAKWLSLPNEPFRRNDDQLRFLADRRSRRCSDCNKDYQATSTQPVCPDCGKAGTRYFNRMAIISGRQWGKSRIGSISGLEEACFPGTTGWACAPTNLMLHRYVIPAFQRIVPKDWVEDWSAEYRDLRLTNGSLIHFQTLDDPDQGRGQTLDWLWIDEACLLTELHWDTIRPSLAGDKVAMFTTSPRGYDWVHDTFYKRAIEGKPGYWACQTRSIDSANPAMTKEFIESERETMSDLRFRQEYEADFVTFEGAVYGELVYNQMLDMASEAHMAKLKEMIPEWPEIAPWRECFIGIDTGADHPTGAVKLVSAGDNLIAVDEYLQRDAVFVQHAEAFKRMAYPHKVKYAINKNERQPMMEFSTHGIHCMGADNDQLRGIERVRTWLYHKRLWFVRQAVPFTCRQMQTLHWQEERKDQQHGDAPRVFKKDDELPDSIRYALMSFPILPREPKEPEINPLAHYPQKVQEEIRLMQKLEGMIEEKKPDADLFWS